MFNELKLGLGKVVPCEHSTKSCKTFCQEKKGRGENSLSRETLFFVPTLLFPTYIFAMP
jgi:hypothetical protein